MRMDSLMTTYTTSSKLRNFVLMLTAFVVAVVVFFTAGGPIGGAGTALLMDTDTVATQPAMTEIDTTALTVQDEPKSRHLATGEASYYGPGFAGRPTANGETFNPAEMTAAHRTLPFGTKLLVTNRANGKSVVVRVNDRGPYAGNRILDLSKGAAQRIGMISSGTANVDVAVLS